jgi:hypothetical protein
MTSEKLCCHKYSDIYTYTDDITTKVSANNDQFDVAGLLKASLSQVGFESSVPRKAADSYY